VNLILNIKSRFYYYLTLRLLTKGGIQEDHMKLALEPEAASVWCQQVEAGKKSVFCRTGSKYMVIDLGGMYVCLALLTQYQRKTTFVK